MIMYISALVDAIQLGSTIETISPSFLNPIRLGPTLQEFGLETSKGRAQNCKYLGPLL